MNSDQLQAYRTYSQRVVKNKRNRHSKNPMKRRFEEDIMRSKIRGMIGIMYPKQ